MRLLALILVIAGSLPAGATTLEQLTMNQIVTRATAIVRGGVSGCTGELWRGAVFTRCDVAVSETWKGNNGKSAVVWLPGGHVQGLSQTFSGSPKLTVGQDYVLFLWAGKSGRNQLIGLTQGVFELRADAKTSGFVAYRQATSELMVDASGQPVSDKPVLYTAAELKKIVTDILARSRQ